MLTNWKTTACGVVLIGIGAWLLVHDTSNAVTGGAIITAGLGLVAAKDSTNHSTSVQVQEATIEANAKKQ